MLEFDVVWNGEILFAVFGTYCVFSGLSFCNLFDRNSQLSSTSCLAINIYPLIDTVRKLPLHLKVQLSIPSSELSLFNTSTLEISILNSQFPTPRRFKSGNISSSKFTYIYRKIRRTPKSEKFDRNVCPSISILPRITLAPVLLKFYFPGRYAAPIAIKAERSPIRLRYGRGKSVRAGPTAGKLPPVCVARHIPRARS